MVRDVTHFDQDLLEARENLLIVKLVTVKLESLDELLDRSVGLER